MVFRDVLVLVYFKKTFLKNAHKLLFQNFVSTKLVT